MAGCKMSPEEFELFKNMLSATPEQAAAYGEYLSRDPDEWDQHDGFITLKTTDLSDRTDLLGDDDYSKPKAGESSEWKRERCRDALCEYGRYQNKLFEVLSSHAHLSLEYRAIEVAIRIIRNGLSAVGKQRIQEIRREGEISRDEWIQAFEFLAERLTDDEISTIVKLAEKEGLSYSEAIDEVIRIGTENDDPDAVVDVDSLW